MGALEDIYNQQRALRQQYPIGDALLNLVPYVGAMASADDVAHNLHDGDYGEAALNAIGLLPGAKLVKMGLHGGPSALKSALGRYMVQSGQAHRVPSAINNMETGVAVGTGGGLGAYLDYIMMKQAEANAGSK